MSYFSIEGFKPNKPGPYSARSASDRTDNWPYWYVEAQGLNCLSGPRGAVLTSQENAKRLADEWNHHER